MAFDLELTMKFVAGEEGFRSEAYDDGFGNLTIGYGETDPSTVERYRATGITQAQAWDLLGRRVSEIAEMIAAAVGRETSVEQMAAMVSLTYNIGTGAFKTSLVCREFRAGNIAAAADAFRNWVTPSVLRARREREIALFLSSVPPADPLRLDGRTALVFEGERVVEPTTAT